MAFPIVFTVTEDDLLQGERWNIYHCPVSLAILRSVVRNGYLEEGEEFRVCWTGSWVIGIRTSKRLLHSVEGHAGMSADLREYVKNYDRCFPVTEKTFTVMMEEWKVE